MRFSRWQPLLQGRTASVDIDDVATATTGTSAFLAARTVLRCARAASSATAEQTVLGEDAMFIFEILQFFF
jgi:hypothetical protein